MVVFLLVWHNSGTNIKKNILLAKCFTCFFQKELKKSKPGEIYIYLT